MQLSNSDDTLRLFLTRRMPRVPTYGPMHACMQPMHAAHDAQAAPESMHVWQPRNPNNTVYPPYACSCDYMHALTCSQSRTHIMA